LLYLIEQREKQKGINTEVDSVRSNRG